MTQPNTVSPRTYVPQDRLYVWAMVNPVAPTLVGEVGLSILEMLLFTGDDRFGALGITSLPRTTSCPACKTWAISN